MTSDDPRKGPGVQISAPATWTGDHFYTAAAVPISTSTPFGAGTSAEVTPDLSSCGVVDVGIMQEDGAASVQVEIAPGIFATGEAALTALAEDAAVQSLKHSDAPIAIADELVAAVTGPTLQAIVAQRVALIADKGHTADADDFLPIGWLPMEADQALHLARQLMGADPQTRDLVAARAKLVEAVAFGMAAIDRLDRGMKQGER